MNRRRDWAAYGWLLTATAAGLLIVGWPLFGSADLVAHWQQSGGAVLSLIVLPLVVAIVINDVIGNRLGARDIALMAALVAVGAIVRVVSPGVAGIEPIWLVVLLAGAALGATAGFTVGVLAVLASAIASAGVGPWLPYQMIFAGWIGLGAGLLPKLPAKWERWLLAGYGAVAGIGYGWAMNLWFWPTAIGLQPALAFDPTSAPLQRLLTLVRFSIATSLGFDLPRAAATALLVLLTGRRLLKSIRRVSRPVAA